jgi:hypothetical protein
MPKRITVKRTRTRIPEYTCLGCPLTKSRTQWCFHLCVPVEGIGPCGRVAPHSLLGPTREAILAHRKRRAGVTAQ